MHGAGASSMTIAATLGHKFCVIVGSKKWIAKMEDNAITYGFGNRIASWKSIGMTVHDFLTEPQKIKDRVAEKAREAVEKDNAGVVVQGCTCESGFTKELIKELKIPILHPVVCSIKWAEMAGDLYRKIRLGQSKVYGYEPPPELRLYQIKAMGERKIATEPRAKGGYGEFPKSRLEEVLRELVNEHITIEPPGSNHGPMSNSATKMLHVATSE